MPTAFDEAAELAKLDQREAEQGRQLRLRLDAAPCPLCGHAMGEHDEEMQGCTGHIAGVGICPCDLGRDVPTALQRSRMAVVALMRRRVHVSAPRRHPAPPPPVDASPSRDPGDLALKTGVALLIGLGLGPALGALVWLCKAIAPLLQPGADLP